MTPVKKRMWDDCNINTATIENIPYPISDNGRGTGFMPLGG